MSKQRHNFGTKRFKEKSLFIFHAHIALKSLILLFVRLIARGGRYEWTHIHTHTHRTTTVTLAAHARQGLIMYKPVPTPHTLRSLQYMYTVYEEHVTNNTYKCTHNIPSIQKAIHTHLHTVTYSTAIYDMCIHTHLTH